VVLLGSSHKNKAIIVVQSELLKIAWDTGFVKETVKMRFGTLALSNWTRFQIALMKLSKRLQNPL